MNYYNISLIKEALLIITDNLKLKLLGRLENFDTETIMEDLQKIDTAYGSTLNNLTDAFDPTKQYQIREYCIKDNVLYKFISTKEAGDWDDSVVVSTTISNEMKEMNATLTQLNSKIGTFSQLTQYPIGSYPNIWDAPSGFYVLYSADTGYLLEVPNEIPGSRVYILKSKITDTNFCMIFSSSRKALYMGYEYGTTHVWQKIVGTTINVN